jgi:hypothetical protein
MLEFILLIIGIFLGIWWYSVIILPLFYGIPKASYYVVKGLLKKSAVIFYLKSFILWTIIWFGIAFILVKYFPNITGTLLESGGFAIGQLIGIGLMMWRVFTKDGRKDLNIDFWDIMFNSRYFNFGNPKFWEIFSSTLTKVFVLKFGDQAQEKLAEFHRVFLSEINKQETSMTNQTTEEIRDEIARKAAAHAEANVYSLNNQYLTPDEKQEVELWFQLPGNVMLWVFVATAVYSVVVEPLPWSKIIGIPLTANVVVGLLNWYAYNKNFIYKLYLTFLHSWILYLVGFGAAAFLFYKGAIALAIISLVAPFGLLAFAEPHLYLYSILAKKYRMHPKFAFFKKQYGRTFPFEQDLD